MKKIKFVLLAFVILVVSTTSSGESFARAESDSGTEEGKTVLEQQQEALSDEGVKVEVLSDEDLKRLKEAEKELEEISDFRGQVSKDGFEKVELDRENSKIKYSAFTDKGRVYTYMSSDAYKNEKTKEVIISEVVYDTYSEEIKQFVVEKRSMVDPEVSEILVNYINGDLSNENLDEKDDGFSLYAGFKWNGKSFTCSMGGLALCGHHCALWAIFNPIAGGGCAVVCGTVFAAACSLS